MSTQALKQDKSILITAGVDYRNINCTLPENIKKIQICIYKNGLLKLISETSLNENEKIQFYLKDKHQPQNIILKVKTETNNTFRFSLNKYCHTIDDVDFINQDTPESRHYFLVPMTEESFLVHCVKKLVERGFGPFAPDITSSTVTSLKTSESIDVH